MENGINDEEEKKNKKPDSSNNLPKNNEENADMIPKIEEVAKQKIKGALSLFSDKMLNIADDLLTLLGQGYKMDMIPKSHPKDFERMHIFNTSSKPGTKKGIDIAIVDDKLNIIITPQGMNYCYTGSFPISDMGKVASVIDTYFKTLICTKSSGMVQKPWHTRENSYDPADEEYADDILGLSAQEKYVRLRMEQEERTILEGLNSIEKVAERLPTSKFWTTMNDEEKAVRLPKQPQ